VRLHLLRSLDSRARSTKTRIETGILQAPCGSGKNSRARSTKTRIETATLGKPHCRRSDSRARSTKTRIETTSLRKESHMQTQIREQDPLKQGLKHIIQMVLTETIYRFASKIH